MNEIKMQESQRPPPKGKDKGTGKEIASKESDEYIPFFLMREQFHKLGYKSRFLANLVASEGDQATWYEINQRREIFTHAEVTLVTVDAIKEYLLGDCLDACIMVVWCM